MLIVAAFRPAEFEVHRSAVIHAPPERIRGLVDDFHRWSRWSPWERLDTTVERSFGGATSGKGATYAGPGNSKVGTGADGEPGGLFVSRDRTIGGDFERGLAQLKAAAET